MVARNKNGALTDEEKPIVKALLAKGWRNQDIQALVNIGREANRINSARITETKKDAAIIAASDEEVEFFKIKRIHMTPGPASICLTHERLIRAREATGYCWGSGLQQPGNALQVRGVRHVGECRMDLPLARILRRKNVRSPAKTADHCS
jgi:hypothetical protein